MTDVVLGVGKVQAVQGLVLDGRTSGRNEHILGAGFTDGLRMKPPSRAYINDNGGGGTTNHGIIDQKNVLSLQRDLRDQARSQHIRGWGCAWSSWLQFERLDRASGRYGQCNGSWRCLHSKGSGGRETTRHGEEEGGDTATAVCLEVSGMGMMWVMTSARH